MRFSLYLLFTILLTSSCVTQKEYARVLDQYLNSEIEKKAQMLECDSIKRAILKENSDFNEIGSIDKNLELLSKERTKINNYQYNLIKQDYDFNF